MPGKTQKNVKREIYLTLTSKQHILLYILPGNHLVHLLVRRMLLYSSTHHVVAVNFIVTDEMYLDSTTKKKERSVGGRINIKNVVIVQLFTFLHIIKLFEQIKYHLGKMQQIGFNATIWFFKDCFHYLVLTIKMRWYSRKCWRRGIFEFQGRRFQHPIVRNLVQKDAFKCYKLCEEISEDKRSNRFRKH